MLKKIVRHAYLKLTALSLKGTYQKIKSYNDSKIKSILCKVNITYFRL